MKGVDFMGVELLSPAPGKILKIHVNRGDLVTEDTAVIRLEAMKMENEIFAPAGGTVTEIRVREGDEVETDDVMAVIN